MRLRIRWRGVLFVLALMGCLAPGGWAATDDDVAARIAAAGDADDYDSNTVIVLDATDVTLAPNGIGTARKHMLTKILREGGIRANSVQVFTFDPHTNNLVLHAIRIHRADGTVEEVPHDHAVHQPQPSFLLYWGTGQFVVQVPRLEIGDTLEVISELTGFNVAYLESGGETGGGTPLNFFGKPLEPPVAGHWHDEVHFWTGTPIIVKRYTVKVPKDKPLQFGVYNGEVETKLTFDEDYFYYSFTKRDIEPFEREPSMEATPNVGTKVLLATLPDWESKSRWLYSVSEPQLEANDEIRAKVAEIIRDCKTDEEKYTALNHWVAENVRYSGTSRGMSEGYTIHDIKETFRDRAGVCKDKAGMLCGMLRVAGFDAYTCMTMARQRVDRIPADQFNHCVTAIRKDDGDFILLDPTWMPKSRDNWSKLEPRQHVVFGVSDGVDLAQSDYFPPEQNEAVWTAQSRIAPDNKLTGEIAFRAVGAPEGRLRRTLAGHHPSNRNEFFDRTFQRISPIAHRTSLTYTDPEDFSGPMVINAKYDAPQYALGDNHHRYFSLPMMQTVFGDRTLYDLFGKTGPDERKYAVNLLATRKARIEETINLPSGWVASDLPEPVSIDGPAAALEFEIESSAGKLHYTCTLAVKHWSIPADEYANFKEVMDKYEELSSHMITCKMEAASARR